MNATCVRVTCGIGCEFLAVLLMNQALFPLFDAVFTYARDISVTTSAIALIALAIVALWRPRVIGVRYAYPVVAAGSLAGFAAACAGIVFGLPLLVVAGACVTVTCRSLSTVVVNMAATTLPVPRMVVCIVAGVLGAYACDLLLAQAGPWVGAALSVVVLPLAMLVLCGSITKRLLVAIVASDPVAELSVTHPASFLPLTSTLYVFQFIVLVAFGFSLRFGEVNGSPSFDITLALVVLVGLLGIVVLRRGELSLDVLSGVVVLTLVAGLMFAAVQTVDGAHVANTVLVVGNALFNVFMTCVLVTLARRSSLSALSIFGWMNGIGGLGTTLGAFMGTSSNALVSQGSEEVVSYLIIVFLLLLLAYVFFALRSYSFHGEIESVETLAAPGTPVQPSVAAVSAEEVLTARCHDIAAAFGLTPREEQTFAMLARGRNREYIESALMVSRNTVKAHVKHVYAKLGIHSHQELIDLVEQTGSPDAPPLGAVPEQM